MERIDAGLIRHEPQEWEIRKAQNEMYELLCTEYEELWDDYCDLKQALQEIAALNPAWEVSAIQAVDKAKRLLKEHG